MDCLDLPTAPTDEQPVQTTAQNYAFEGERECKAFIAQLLRVFGKPPGSANFRIRKALTDEGFYYELLIYFDESSEEQLEYARNVESHIPSAWDKEARIELGLGKSKSKR